MNNYQFNLTWSNKDKEYIATCPEFPGLSAFGETPEDALAEAKIALELFIETYEEDGKQLPEPQTVHEYSGEFRARLPKSLHAKAANLAASEGISLNTAIVCAVQSWVSGNQVYEKIEKSINRFIIQNFRIYEFIRANNIDKQSNYSIPKQFTVSLTAGTDNSLNKINKNEVCH